MIEPGHEELGQLLNVQTLSCFERKMNYFLPSLMMVAVMSFVESIPMSVRSHIFVVDAIHY
jgi:hypothetical protein